MPDFVLKKRHRLKRKVIRQLVEGIGASFGVTPDWEDSDLDGAKGPTGMVYILDGEIVALEVDGTPALALRGLLRINPPRGFVTVDMGAVKFIYNGADVMAPGVVDADLSIGPGAPVYVRDQKNLRPLAVGVALMSGKEMAISTSDKAVRTVHHVGDGLWTFGHEDD